MSFIKYSHTLWSPADTVRDVAETLGITTLPDEVAKALAMDVEYRIHEVVQEACKFMRHNKKTTLTTAEISQALAVLNVEPLYGYNNIAAAQPLSFHQALVGPGQTLYYVDDDEDVDFERIINQPLPKVPRAVSMTAHWLAIEGVQPAVPQNPIEAEVRALPPAVRGAQTNRSVSTLAENVDLKPLVKHVVSRELQLYFDRVVAALVAPGTSESETQLRAAALGSLQNDPGLHQLVPYLVHFVQEKVSHTLKANPAVLSTMLDVVHALLLNPTIFVEPYIHHLMPAILTPLLARKVGLDAAAPLAYDIRDKAAALLLEVCTKFGDSYQSLRPRVARTLLKAFMDTSRPLSALYGAVIGLKALGAETVRVIIVGNAKSWYPAVVHHYEGDDHGKLRMEQALLEALRTLKLGPEGSRQEQADEGAKAKFADLLGPEIAALVADQPDAAELLHDVPL